MFKIIILNSYFLQENILEKFYGVIKNCILRVLFGRK